MKKWLLRLILPYLKKRIKSVLNDDEFKTRIIKDVNKKMDLPKLDEEAERQILEQIYTALKSSIEITLDNV